MKKKMDETLKQRWVAALRSGEYKQASGNLCIRDADGNRSHCCLGVLAEVVGGPDTWEEWYGQSRAVGALNCSTMFFGDSLMDIDVNRAVMRMNDDGISFDEIADYLEAHA